MKKLVFYQMFEHESSTYTYLIGDEVSREAVLIDPVLETLDRDLKLTSDLGLKLKYVLDTHIHADHITSAGQIREITQVKTCVGKKSGVQCADILLDDMQQLQIGAHTITVLETPGHTQGCVTYMVEDMLFTGDALLVRGNGRTDFQGGSSEKLYDSIQKLFNLKGDYTVYPAHDYRGHTKTTIELEKKCNPRVGNGTSKDDFIKIMSELKLANPKKIMEAVSANMACGFKQEVRSIETQLNNGLPELTPEQLFTRFDKIKSKVKFIDVRRPDEFNGELGHIAGAQLVTLGEPLKEYLSSLDKSDEIVFVCRSGARSAEATKLSLDLGFKFTANMVGGMIRWNENKFPTEKG